MVALLLRFDPPVRPVHNEERKNKLMSKSPVRTAFAILVLGALPVFSSSSAYAQQPGKELSAPRPAEIRFASTPLSVPVQAQPQNAVQSADAASRAPADKSDKGGVIYRRLTRGNFMASHYDAAGKLTRRDIYRQPNQLDVIHYNDAGKVTFRQSFLVALDVYLREGKFGYQHEWIFALKRLEVFHADGKTLSKVVVFHQLGGQADVVREHNERGGLVAVRSYRLDGSRAREQTFKNGRMIRSTRHAASENLREQFDAAHVGKPDGTLLIDSEAKSEDDGKK